MAPCAGISLDGLVSWWKGEDDADDWTQQNTGEENGGINYEPGLVGKAFSFDGDNDYVYVQFQQPVEGDVRVELWTKYEGAQNTNTRLFHFWSDGSTGLNVATGGQQIRIDNGTFRTDGGGPPRLMGAFPAGDGEWHHIAVTRSGTEYQLYVDGVLADEGPRDGPIRTFDRLFIGSGRENENFFNGLLHEVRLFNRVLTLSEINEIVEAGPAGKCPDGPLDGLSMHVDLSPDIFEVEVVPGVELTAYLEAPAGVDAEAIRQGKVELQVNGTSLGEPQSAKVVGNAVVVRFALTLSDISEILGLAVTEAEVDQAGNTIRVKAAGSPAQPIDLVQLTVSVVLENGDRLSGNDAVRVVSAQADVN